MSQATDGGGFAAELLAGWERLRRLPGGGRLFGALLGRRVPYAGTLKFRVEALAPGHAVLSMADRRGLRNHIGSLHAMALGNLGEATSGLAMLAGLPEDRRGIPVRAEIDYLKKARGRITATCTVDAAALAGDGPVPVPVVLTDGAGDVVARVVMRWRVGARSTK